MSLFMLCIQWLDLHNVIDICCSVSCRLCVIAGNISPIDVITHLPILCEEANVPYIYVTSKEVCCIFTPIFMFSLL